MASLWNFRYCGAGQNRGSNRASGFVGLLNDPRKRGIAKRPLDQSLDDGSVEGLIWLGEARPSMLMLQRAELLRKSRADDGIELLLGKWADRSAKGVQIRRPRDPTPRGVLSPLQKTLERNNFFGGARPS